MKLAILWLYTAWVVFVWVFFIIAKMHSFKFKKFSKNVVPVTKFLAILLFCLTVIWYIVIYAWDLKSSSNSDKIEIYY